MAILNGHVWSLLLLLNVLESTVLATPLYTSQFFATGNARNIRHLPCVSLRTGETGVCMFAFNCVKANGTHLGTCLDRFYFGSCCKISEEPDVFPQDNSIDESNTFGSTGKPIESNDIPDYLNKPKPDKVPTVLTTEKPITSAYTTPTTTSTTIPPSIALSTFQTIQDNKTPTATKAPTTVYYSRPSTTEKIVTTESYVKRPTTVYLSSVIHNATTVRPAPTRFPPRNATTSQAPTTKRPTTVTSKRPITSPSTKRPPVITKRPSKPSTISTSSSIKPSTAFTSTKPSTVFTSTKPSTAFTSTKPSTASTSTKPSTAFTSTKPSTAFTSTNLPSTLKPVVQQTTLSSSTLTTAHRYNATSATTLTSTRRPIVSSTIKIPKPTSAPTRGTVGTTVRPRPTSKPTKTTVTSVKPTKTSARPSVADKPKPKPSSTTLKPSTKPRPTGKPTKPLKPVKPEESTVGSSTIPTTVGSTTTRTTPSTSTTIGASTTITTTEKVTTIANEILPPKISVTTGNISSSTPTSTQGFVTWSSNSDEHVTLTTVSSTSTTSEPQVFSEVTETEWSPITTPDGWVMIQSPSTKKPGSEETATEGPILTSTSLPSTSAETTTQRVTTEQTTSKPTVPTVTSSTASTITTATPDAFASLNMSDYKQVCGRRLFPESRIVGGDRSSFGKWPWQISLRQWRTSAYLHKCGAALLNENWAITAAHCVENVPPSDLLLRIGEHDLANEDEPYGFQERRVQIVASHPQFDPRTFEYDLALLRFYEPILPFQPNLLPICLPDDDEGYVGHTAYVTGWGRLYEDGPLPSVLQEVSVPVINNTVCEAMYRNAGYIEHIPHIFICAGWRKGGFDSCEGDSGGPMVIQRPRDKRWILAGVISWGIGCAEPNQPGVYTRISEFREWINQILQF